MMEDGAIVALYFARNEDAIRETDQNMANYAIALLIIFCIIVSIMKSVSMIHILLFGTKYLRRGRGVYVLFFAGSYAIYR